MFERILLIRLSALGDVLLATPALRALRLHFPKARLDWLVDAAYAPLLQNNPHLSRLVIFDRLGEHAGAAGFLRMVAQLRRQAYDLVVDLQGKPKTAALARAIGAQKVIQIEKRTRSELLRAAIGVDRPNVRRHAAEMCLDALAELGVAGAGSGLDCAIPARANELADALLGGSREPAWIGIAPGARWATKRWEPARFGEVANALVASGQRVVLLGGAADLQALEGVHAKLTKPACDTRELGVDGLIGVIARCKLVVCGDSGPAHIADALGIPTVALYGPTSPRRWAPRDPRHRIIHKDLVCSPCSNHGAARCPIGTLRCMREIGAEEVAAAALEVLGSREAAGP